MHDISYEEIETDPELREMILKIQIPRSMPVTSCQCAVNAFPNTTRYPNTFNFVRWVFTASVESHAKRCLTALGIDDIFVGIIDCKSVDLVTKHSPEAFDAAMKIAGVTDPSLCIFADDSVKNIETAKAKGWTTILVGDKTRDENLPIVCPAADHMIATIHQLPDVMPELF